MPVQRPPRPQAVHVCPGPVPHRPPRHTSHARARAFPRRLFFFPQSRGPVRSASRVRRPRPHVRRVKALHRSPLNAARCPLFSTLTTVVLNSSLRPPNVCLRPGSSLFRSNNPPPPQTMGLPLPLRYAHPLFCVVFHDWGPGGAAYSALVARAGARGGAFPCLRPPRPLPPRGFGKSVSSRNRRFNRPQPLPRPPPPPPAVTRIPGDGGHCTPPRVAVPPLPLWTAVVWSPSASDEPLRPRGS